MKKIIYITFVFYANLVFSQVGIGTTNPQQDLHLAASNSTIRIESLNSTNKPSLNNSSKLAPVYVTNNGDLTLNPPGYNNDSDLGNLEPLNFLIDIPDFIPNGPYGDGTVVANDTSVTSATAQIASAVFTTPQTALFEVRYVMTIDLSDQPLPAPAASTFSDVSARTIRCYFYIDINNDGLDATELSKVYGFHGEAYTSFKQGSVGYAFIHGVGYGNIPAGTHSLVFYGETIDGTNKNTYVGFGGSSDYLKIRIYN